MKAYGYGYQRENTLYYSIYYGLLEYDKGTGETAEMPFFVIALSTNESDEARTIMNDTVDYAIEHAVY